MKFCNYWFQICVLLCIFLLCNCQLPYTPDWSSLDKRPLPLWYDDAKFGIFIHWGLYSVPSFGSEWFWWYWKGQSPNPRYVNFMNTNFKPNFSYGDFGPMFTTEFFNPEQWADLLSKSGAKYVVLTSKHHEGFTMWPSKYSWNWNSFDVGSHRDIVDELGRAVRNKNLTFGLYFSQFEWFNPLYNKDAANHFNTTSYSTLVSLPQLNEIVTKYKPEVLWSDGDAGPDSYWKSKEFISWLYNESPVKETVVTNDRWGTGIMCKHGDFYTCDDRYNPGTLQKHKWENCMTVYKSSWGFDRTGRFYDYLSTKELLNNLVDTVSCGGNLLLNIGPTHDGLIIPIFQERLLEIGQWLKINGEAIYQSKPWIYQNDTKTPNVWYTSQVRQNKGLNVRRLQNPQHKANTVVYATIFEWPSAGLLKLGAIIPTKDTQIQMLGTGSKISWKASQPEQGIVVDLNDILFTEMPSFIAWTLKIEYLKTQSV